MAEVDAVLRDAASLPRWRPSVYLEVHVLVPGDATGLGKTVELLTQGWEPPPPRRWKLHSKPTVSRQR